MTSRERMKAILSREPYDHYGIYEHFWGETLNEAWPEQGFVKDTDPAEMFNYDLKGIGGGPDATPFRDAGEELEETDEWKITRSGWGAALKYWKHHSGTPEHMDFKIKDPETWKPYREQIVDVTDPTRMDIEGIRKNHAEGMAGDKFCVYSHLFVVETLRHALGDVNMLESLILEPAWIHDICRVITDFFIRHYELLFSEVGKPDGMFIYEDLGFANGLFASPKTMNELIFPYYTELVDYFHQHGLPVILHACGGVTEAVPMVVETGFNCLQPLEAKAKVDVVELAEAFGDKISFMGNMDVTVLNTNDKGRVKDEVMGKLNALYKLDADYVFHSDHSVPPDIDFETYKYAVGLYRDFCHTHRRGL
jgi:uroporphyrinogen decarboxylase